MFRRIDNAGRQAGPSFNIPQEPSIRAELAFDPVKEIAEAARAHFSVGDLRRYLSRLAGLAVDDGLLQPFYLRALGSSPLVDSAERDRAFLAQLRELKRRELPPDRLAELLQALRPWEQSVGSGLLQEIKTALAETADPSLVPLKRLIAKARR